MRMRAESEFFSKRNPAVPQSDGDGSVATPDGAGAVGSLLTSNCSTRISPHDSHDLHILAPPSPPCAAAVRNFT